MPIEQIVNLVVGFNEIKAKRGSRKVWKFWEKVKSEWSFQHRPWVMVHFIHFNCNASARVVSWSTQVTMSRALSVLDVITILHLQGLVGWNSQLEVLSPPQPNPNRSNYRGRGPRGWVKYILLRDLMSAMIFNLGSRWSLGLQNASGGPIRSPASPHWFQYPLDCPFLLRIIMTSSTPQLHNESHVITIANRKKHLQDLHNPAGVKRLHWSIIAKQDWSVGATITCILIVNRQDDS